MMHENVPLADQGEHIGFGIGQAGRDFRLPRGIAQIGAIDGGGEGHEIGFSQRLGDFVDGIFADFEAFH